MDADDVLIGRRERPICSVPEIGIGNKPIDDGNYLFSTEERDEFLKKEPTAKKYFRRWQGAAEFLNGYERWCLWLGECPSSELAKMPEARKRVEAVKAYRLASKSAPTRALASTPARFHVENIPDTPYLVIPEVSSERRDYIPLGYLEPNTLASNKLRILPNANLLYFGVLQSAMHMSWTRYTTGRMKSDFQYSISVVYNNFPWPTQLEDKKIVQSIERAAEQVLKVRAEAIESDRKRFKSYFGHALQPWNDAFGAGKSASSARSSRGCRIRSRWWEAYVGKRRRKSGVFVSSL